jgi:lysozyme
MTDNVLGLDLNDYRKGVPLKTAKQQGVRFVINKATQGTSIVHETNEIYRGRCANLGLPFGNYMYWKFAGDAGAQARFYVKHIGKVQFPPIVDVERYGNVKTGTSTVPIVSIQANRNHLKIVLNEIERLTGVKPMIYTNWASWKYLFGNWSLILDHPLWVANWRLTGSPTLPVPATKWYIHQYTSSYKIEGYYRGVDANWFNGNETAFEKYIQVYDELWNPPPPPPPVTTKSFASVEVMKGGNSSIYLLDQPGDYVKIQYNEVKE